MQQWITFVVVLLVAHSKQLQADQSAQPSLTKAEWAPDRIIVKYKAGTKSATSPRAQVVRLKAGSDVWAAVKAYQQNTDVEYAVPDYHLHLDEVPSDPLFANQQWGLQRISAPAAWDTTTGGTSVTVCTVDSGVDYTHPDLAANIHPSRGFNVLDGSNDPMDELNHGTHVAGIMAAVGNNGKDIAGMNWKAKLLACKFIDASGAGLSSNAITCIDYCVSQRAKVITASFSGGDYNQAMVDAINRAGAAGALFVSSAGNKGADLDGNPSYPASYRLPNMLVVGSSSTSDQLSRFSNSGASSVDLVAPGEQILSTVPGGGTLLMSGTSMAGPFVAGAAVLLQSAAKGKLTVAKLKQLLLSSVDVVPQLNGRIATGGRLNVDQALQKYLFSKRKVQAKSLACKKSPSSCKVVCPPPPYLKSPPICTWVLRNSAVQSGAAQMHAQQQTQQAAQPATVATPAVAVTTQQPQAKAQPASRRLLRGSSW